MPISRKALNYDLDDNLLKKYYPHPKSYKNAWTNVKDLLCDNGFETRQYSGVVSIKQMTYFDATDIILLLNKHFKWLAPCVKEFDVTNVGSTYGLTFLFENKQ